MPAELSRGAVPSRRERFDPALAVGLPGAVRRWLGHVIAPGAVLAGSVELTMRGRIRLGRWRPFVAQQVLAMPGGFVWAAVARVAGLPVRGFDRYSGGTGQMQWRLLGAVPVLRADGPDVMRSAAGRFAAEATVLLPTAFRGARWTGATDPGTAIATWHVGDQSEAVQLTVGPDGRVVGVLMQRWGNPDGRPFGRYPFGVTVDQERTFGGITIPAVFRAGWWWGTSRQADGEFFRAQITTAEFRPPTAVPQAPATAPSARSPGVGAP